jgi:hypothetical protein
MLRLVAFLLWLALSSLVSLVIEGAKLWLLVKPYKRFKAWRAKRRGVTVLQGKVTYASLGTLFVALAATVLGDGVITAADLDELGQAVLAVVAVYGRYRATKQQ